MAHESVIYTVVGQRNTAVRALIDEAALHARYQLVCTAAVQKQDALLPAVDILSDLFLQEKADIPVPPVTELLSRAKDLDDLTDLVFSPLPEDFQPKILEYKDITWHCGCSRERMAQALMTIGEEELSTLLAEDGQAELSCQFCGSRYLFTEEDLRQMLDTIGKRS